MKSIMHRFGATSEGYPAVFTVYPERSVDHKPQPTKVLKPLFHLGVLSYNLDPNSTLFKCIRCNEIKWATNFYTKGKNRRESSCIVCSLKRKSDRRKKTKRRLERSLRIRKYSSVRNVDDFELVEIAEASDSLKFESFARLWIEKILCRKDQWVSNRLG